MGLVDQKINQDETTRPEDQKKKSLPRRLWNRLRSRGNLHARLGKHRHLARQQRERQEAIIKIKLNQKSRGEKQMER